MPRRRRKRWNNKRVTYNGVRFRSKLESYCAKRFDKYEVKWEYEHRLIIGETWCAPDFYLPEYDVYIEVRPEKLVDEKLLRKIVAIREHHNKETIIIHHQREVKECLAKLSSTSQANVE